MAVHLARGAFIYECHSNKFQRLLNEPVKLAFELPFNFSQFLKADICNLQLQQK